MEPYRIRLSLMMFGQYIIMGAWLVTLGTYLMASPSRGGLNFPPSYAGWIYSALAIAGIISPMFVGLLADRLFSAQKLMAFFHLTGALLLGAAAWWFLISGSACAPTSLKAFLNQPYSGHSAPVNAVAFSPDGTTVASGDGEKGGTSGTVKIWDASTGKTNQTATMTGAVTSLALVTPAPKIK